MPLNTKIKPNFYQLIVELSSYNIQWNSDKNVSVCHSVYIYIYRSICLYIKKERIELKTETYSSPIGSSYAREHARVHVYVYSLHMLDYLNIYPLSLVHAHTCTYMCVYIFMSMYVCMYVCMICLSIYLSIYIYIYIYLYLSIYLYVYTCLTVIQATFV